MADIVAAEVKKDAGWLVFGGSLIILAGVIALGSPFFAGLAVSKFVGFMLLFAGVLRAYSGFKAQSWGGTLLSLLVGVATFAVGGLMLARPMFGLASITLYLAIYFFVEGVGECLVAFEHKPNNGWVWTLIGGLISITLGVMIWRQWPVSGAWAVGTLFGIHLLFVGWAQVAIGSAARSLAGEIPSS
jgi:uncharacterized membrane protein HdeD (DUF308 family)